MNQASIFWPVMCLIGWTMVVLTFTAYRRISASLTGRVRTRDFKLGESSNVPPDVSLPNRNLINLFELPVLFYVVCATLFMIQRVDALALSLAWAYLFARVLHSGVHMTYNRVLHRFWVFAASNVVLLALWIKTLIALAN